MFKLTLEPFLFRSRSCPVQSHVPKAPQRKKKLNATLETDTPQQKGIPAPFEIDVNRIRLPPHWSIGNSNGMLYYVDHQNKTTTYDDPRIQIREKLKYEHQMLCMNEVSLLFYVGVGSMLQRFFEDTVKAPIKRP